MMPGHVKYVKDIQPGAPYLVGGTDEENCKMLAKLCKKNWVTALTRCFSLGAAVATIRSRRGGRGVQRRSAADRS